jgi:hypothetical protein
MVRRRKIEKGRFNFDLWLKTGKLPVLLGDNSKLVDTIRRSFYPRLRLMIKAVSNAVN